VPELPDQPRLHNKKETDKVKQVSKAAKGRQEKQVIMEAMHNQQLHKDKDLQEDRA
jgi:hypothetical protein